MDTNDLRPDDLGNEMPESAEDTGSVPAPAESHDPSAAFTFVLPSDPEEPDDTAEFDTPQSDPADSVPETPPWETDQGETVIFEAPVKEAGPETGPGPVPETPDDTGGKDPSVETPDISEDARESEPVAEKKKSRKALWITLAALVLLLALGCGWFFLLGPGAKHYRVSFDTDGGNDLKPVSVVTGKTAKLPTPEKEGYEFKGWTLNGKAIDNPFVPDSDVTLKATWEGKEFTVYFNSSGGTPGETKKTFRTGEAVVFPADPVKSGYTLAKWNDADGKEFKAETPMPPNDLYLFAEWIDKSYKITFDTDGGTAIQPLLLKEGASFPTVTTTKENYTFDHWEDPKGNTVKPGDILPAQDVILHAKWKKNTFTVSFDSKGGSSVSSVTVNAGDTLKLPANPTREYYDFVCWEDKNSTPIYDGALLAPNDITLYAVWKRQTFTVTFDSKGGTYVAPITVNAGDTLSLPEDPTHEKFYFLCWEDKNGTTIHDQALLEPHDITLYAVWKSWTPLSIGILSPHDEVSNNGYEITIKVADGTDTVIMANQDVTWSWESNGVMSGAKVDEEYGWELDFTATYVDGQQATIKVTAEDESVVFITVIPEP